MSPEDHEIWSRITETVTPNGCKKPSRASSLLVASYLRWTFRPRLDLHGLKIADAYAEVQRHISEASRRGVKSVEIITGLSGAIRREFPYWLDDRHDVSRVESLNGGGAFRVVLRPLASASTPSR